MIDFIKQNKVFVGIIFAVVVLVGGYFIYGAGGTPSEGSALTSTGVSETSKVSRELLATLSNLKSISLDSSIFTDSVFLSLTDFGTVIPVQPVGRDNPFARLSPSGVRATSGTTGTTVTVGPDGKTTTTPRKR